MSAPLHRWILLTKAARGWRISLPMKKMQETQVQSLVRENPLEEEMATHSSTLVWKIPWTEKPGRLQSMGSQRVRQDWATEHTHTHTHTHTLVPKEQGWVQRANTENCESEEQPTEQLMSEKAELVEKGKRI